MKSLVRRIGTAVAATSLLVATAVLGPAHAPAYAKEKKSATTQAPDLTKACAKECPSATNNQDAVACVEKLEKVAGEHSFKKSHPSCYQAHEKYEKATGTEEREEESEQAG